MNQIHLSSENFIKALQGKLVEDEEGKKHNFLRTRYPIRSVEHRNVVVIDERIVVFDKIDIKPVQDENVLVFPYTVLIKGGRYENVFVFSGGIFQASVYIDGGVFQRAFLITGGEFQSSFVITKGSQFLYRFAIDGGEFNGAFNIEGMVTFPDLVSIGGGVFKDQVNILGGNFMNDFTIYGGKFHDFSIFGMSEFHSKFTIEGGEFLFFHIEGNAIFHSLVQVLKGEFKDQFTITGGVFKDRLQVYGGSFSKKMIIYTPNESLINELIFSFLSPIEHRIEIREGSNINNLVFKEGVAANGRVQIQPIQLNKLIFENFTNEGRLEIIGIDGLKSKISTLEIRESYLGNTIFRNFNFYSFRQIIINSSEFSNIKLIDSYFPLRGNQVANDAKSPYSWVGGKTLVSTEVSQEPIQMAELYNQLYLAMKQQGRRPLEMEFYAIHLYWLRKGTVDWRNRLPIMVHGLSTKYGTRWYKALNWIFGLGLLLYFFYSVSLSGIEIGFQHLSWKNFWFHLNHFFQFLFPVRKLSFIAYTQLTPLATLIDIFWRIAQGYLIYQMITAFRRFGRK